MGYSGKMHNDYASAEAIVEHVKNGGIINRYTAYTALLRVTQEWPGTDAAREAQYLIDTEYYDQK